jgi:adenylate cyclase
MDGNEGSLKESALGVNLFGRGPAFDPRMDPVVRVDARRLRAKLTEYYNTEGANDVVVIGLPKGHYTPVFSWRDPLEGPPAQQAGALELLPQRDSVAVLPFISLNADPECQYFSDGLTEDVITAMTRIAGLRVIGRSTVSCYQGKAQDIRKIGRELNVVTIVEGTVRRTGTRLRISARLLDTTDCFHLWAQSWEWEDADILAVQKEISGAIEDITRQTLKTGRSGATRRRRALLRDEVVQP